MVFIVLSAETKSFVMTRRVCKWYITADSNSIQCSALLWRQTLQNGEMHSLPLVSVNVEMSGRDNSEGAGGGEDHSFWAIPGANCEGSMFCSHEECFLVHILLFVQTK